jgi:signal transduction histidine kinase
VKSTLADGEPRSKVEITLHDPGGQLTPVACSTALLHGADNVSVGVVAVFNDLSRLKELETERRRVERLASLEAIASGLVHEIRNPLVAVKTFTQLLPARFDDQVFREQCPRVVAREVSRIEELLSRFRTLAAPSAVPMEPVNLLEAMQATLEALSPVLERTQIAVRQVLGGVPSPVLGNMSRLEELFRNLCLNAIEAMGSGGELTVRIADLAEASGGSVLVEIADTGSGIPGELLESIFNPFVTTKATGTGLGLAICRSIADAHHATLRARNNTERAGATFTLEFPIQAGRSAKVAV